MTATDISSTNDSLKHSDTLRTSTLYYGTSHYNKSMALSKVKILWIIGWKFEIFQYF